MEGAGEEDIAAVEEDICRKEEGGGCVVRRGEERRDEGMEKSKSPLIPWFK